MKMSKWLVIVLLLAACTEAGTTPSSDSAPASTSRTSPLITSTSQPVWATSSTTAGSDDEAGLVKLDPLTLEPVDGLDRMVVPSDSWNVVSTDGSLLVNFHWDKASRINYGTVIDLAGWGEISNIEVGPHAGGITVHEGKAYAYDHEDGRLFTVDLATDEEETLDEWPSGLYFWDGLHVTPDSQVVALGSSPADVIEDRPQYSVFVYDASSETTSKLEFGLMERVNRQTGVFDGDVEIQEEDSPGVAWGDSKVFIVWADGPEIIEVDFDTGTVDTHLIDTTSWLDRLLAYWMPTATAKGPGLGTNSSAALSPDGRYLYFSGNRQEIETADDGSLIEESHHLGLTVVDTDTWTTVSAPDLPVQYVRNSGGGVMAVNTTSVQPWTDDNYIMEVDSGEIVSRGPYTVKGGSCDLTSDGTHLFCIEHTSSTKHLRLIDIESSETAALRPVGFEDSLHASLILQDNPPEVND